MEIFKTKCILSDWNTCSMKFLVHIEKPISAKIYTKCPFIDTFSLQMFIQRCIFIATNFPGLKSVLIPKDLLGFEKLYCPVYLELHATETKQIKWYREHPHYKDTLQNKIKYNHPVFSHKKLIFSCFVMFLCNED